MTRQLAHVAIAKQNRKRGRKANRPPHRRIPIRNTDVLARELVERGLASPCVAPFDPHSPKVKP